MTFNQDRPATATLWDTLLLINYILGTINRKEQVLTICGFGLDNKTALFVMHLHYCIISYVDAVYVALAYLTYLLEFFSNFIPCFSIGFFVYKYALLRKAFAVHCGVMKGNKVHYASCQNNLEINLEQENLYFSDNSYESDSLGLLCYQTLYIDSNWITLVLLRHIYGMFYFLWKF